MKAEYTITQHIFDSIEMFGSQCDEIEKFEGGSADREEECEDCGGSSDSSIF